MIAAPTPSDQGSPVIIANLDCRLCDNGQLVFTVGTEHGLFLECEKCMTCYGDPADLTAHRFRGEDLTEATGPATRAEITAAGWEDLIA